MTIYSLPDGRITTSAKKYTLAWASLADKVSEALNLDCIAYDPTLRFRDRLSPLEYGGPTVDIPVWLARRIVDLHRKGSLYDALREDTEES